MSARAAHGKMPEDARNSKGQDGGDGRDAHRESEARTWEDVRRGGE